MTIKLSISSKSSISKFKLLETLLSDEFFKFDELDGSWAIHISSSNQEIIKWTIKQLQRIITIWHLADVKAEEITSYQGKTYQISDKKWNKLLLATAKLNN